MPTANKLATVDDIRNLAFTVTSLLREGKLEPKQANPTLRSCAMALQAEELSQSAAKMAFEQAREDIKTLQDMANGYGNFPKDLRHAAQERLKALIPRMGQ